MYIENEHEMENPVIIYHLFVELLMNDIIADSFLIRAKMINHYSFETNHMFILKYLIT